MSNISKVSNLSNGLQKQVDLPTNTPVVSSIIIGGVSGTELTKTILDGLLSLGGSATEFTIVNNRTTPTNITNLIVNKDNNKAFKLEYSLIRSYDGTSGGSVNATFCTNAIDSTKFSTSVYAIIKQSDGKVLVGGAFINYAGTSGRNRLVRLNSDGTLDTTFTDNASYNAKFNSAIRAVKLQSNGQILVGGAFTNYAGTSNRSYLVRLNSDGTLDTTFCTNVVDGTKFSGAIYALEELDSGKILIGGLFSNYNGTTGRDRLIRLNSDTTLDTVFCTNAVDGAKIGSTGILVIKKQIDNKIIIGGNFANYAGVSGRNFMVRINYDGTVDTAFCTNAIDGKGLSIVRTIYIQSDGQILFGGDFSNYGGVSGRDRLVMVGSDGTVNSAFCTSASDSSRFNSSTQAIGLLTDGTILVGGDFTNYAGTSGRSYLVALGSDTSDTELITQGSLSGLYRPSTSTWSLSNEDYAGDLSGVDFSIDSTGQIKYVSTNIFGTEIESKMKYFLTLL